MVRWTFIMILLIHANYCNNQAKTNEANKPHPIKILRCRADKWKSLIKNPH